eukprot:jgi/Tetstr1/466874/TSEL_011330.t1
MLLQRHRIWSHCERPAVNRQCAKLVSGAIQRRRWQASSRSSGGGWAAWRRPWAPRGSSACRRRGCASSAIGGVGSWAAEALARSGVGHITLVDLDEVCVSNVNRQVHALDSTVGQLKGHAMARRIADINPLCSVTCVDDFLGEDNAAGILAPPGVPAYDYVLDAVDRDVEKAAIINFCCRNRIPVMTVGGSGGVVSPEGLQIDDLNQVGTDRLLFRTRKRLRNLHGWAAEPPMKRLSDKPRWGVAAVTLAAPRPEELRGPRGNISCNAAGGSLCFVTGAVGFFAASHIAGAIAAGASGGSADPTNDSTAGHSRPWEAESGSGRNDGADDRRLEAHRRASLDDAARSQLGEATAAEDAAAVAALDLFDAHCHPQLGVDDLNQLPDFERLAPQVKRMAVMSTQEADWDASQALCAADPARRALALGVHPWHAHSAAPAPAGRPDDTPGRSHSAGQKGCGGWLERLEERLLASPAAVVGEIGLDRKWTTPDTGEIEYDKQTVVFRQQMELATRLQRPAVLHCVHAFGDLMDTLRGAERLPPVIYLHSYSGSAAFATSLLKLKGGVGQTIYFGFSAFVNLRIKKTRAVLAAVPEDRILLESDLLEPAEMQSDCLRMLRVIAEVKGWSLEEAAARTFENAERFYRLTSP